MRWGHTHSSARSPRARHRPRAPAHVHAFLIGHGALAGPRHDGRVRAADGVSVCRCPRHALGPRCPTPVPSQALAASSRLRRLAFPRSVSLALSPDVAEILTWSESRDHPAACTSTLRFRPGYVGDACPDGVAVSPSDSRSRFFQYLSSSYLIALAQRRVGVGRTERTRCGESTGPKVRGFIAASCEERC